MAKSQTIQDPIVKEVVKSLETPGYGASISDTFSDFLNVIIYAGSCRTIWEGSGTFETLINKDCIIDALNALGEAAPFRDILGDVYMFLSSRHKGSALGQYFTPDPLTRCMSEIILGDIENHVGLTFMEPACGSGGMVLAAAKKVGTTRNTCQWWAQDLDLICVKMCVAQCLYNSIPAYIYHGNSLTNEIYSGYQVYLNKLDSGFYQPLIRKLLPSELHYDLKDNYPAQIKLLANWFRDVGKGVPPPDSNYYRNLKTLISIRR